jgi:hypothetical protein
MQQDYASVQSGQTRPEVQESITQLGLDYRLMTQFTSFVAVEEAIVTEGGKAMRVDVPVEMPAGVSYEGVFGERRQAAPAASGFAGGVMRMAKSALVARAAVQMAPPLMEAETRVREEKAPDADAVSDALGKLDPQLRAMVGQTGRQVEIEIWLADATPEILAALARLGFVDTVAPKVAKIRTGKLAVEQLEALARLDGVRLVKPVAR